MARKGTDQQVNITLTEENGNSLKKYCAENNLSRNGAMNRAVEYLTLDRLRSAAPDQAAYVEDFEIVMDKALRLYRQSIERTISADDRARAEVRGQLEGMATLSRANEKLEAEKEDLQKKVTALEGHIADQNEQIQILKGDLEKNTDERKELEALRKQCAELTQEKADIIAHYTEKIAELQEDGFAKILTVAKTMIE